MRMAARSLMASPMTFECGYVSSSRSPSESLARFRGDMPPVVPAETETRSSCAQYSAVLVPRSNQLFPMMPDPDGLRPVPIVAWPGPVKVVECL